MTAKDRLASSVPSVPTMPVLPTMSMVSSIVKTGLATPNQPTQIETVIGDSMKGPRSLVTVIAELCKGCELCVHACPTGNLKLSESLNRKGYHPAVFKFNGTRGPCSACGICYWVCPDMAITKVGRLGP